MNMASSVLRTDYNDQEPSNQVSIEDFEMWSLDALKDYCRKRCFKVSGSKKELVARVYVLCSSNVPEQPSARDEEASNKRDYKTLHMAAIPAPDPHKLQKWVGEKDGIRCWPPITYVDIDVYMRKHGSVGLTTEGLTAYKTGKAYSYYACDWLKEVLYHPITKKHECAYLKADCTPSNRLNNSPHSLWVKVKKTGEVVSAYCSCMAG